MGKIIKKFYDFYFSSYGWKFIENGSHFEYKYDNNSQKNNNCEIGNLIFLSFHPIPDLSCKLQNFWTNFFLYNMENIEQKINFNFFLSDLKQNFFFFFSFYLFLTYKSKYYLLLITNINHWVAERLMRWAVGRWSRVRATV